MSAILKRDLPSPPRQLPTVGRVRYTGDMQAVHIALAALVVAAVARMLWTWGRGSRRARRLVPLDGRWGQPLQFRPGPALLPEYDDDAAIACVQPRVRRKHVRTVPASAASLCTSNPFARAFSTSGAGTKGVTSA
jgi:hypothetical protein